MPIIYLEMDSFLRVVGLMKISIRPGSSLQTELCSNSTFAAFPRPTLGERYTDRLMRDTIAAELDHTHARDTRDYDGAGSTESAHEFSREQWCQLTGQAKT